jgi:hypothetical protein
VGNKDSRSLPLDTIDFELHCLQTEVILPTIKNQLFKRVREKMQMGHRGYHIKGVLSDRPLVLFLSQ